MRLHRRDEPIHGSFWIEHASFAIRWLTHRALVPRPRPQPLQVQVSLLSKTLVERTTSRKRDWQSRTTFFVFFLFCLILNSRRLCKDFRRHPSDTCDVIEFSGTLVISSTIIAVTELISYSGFMVQRLENYNRSSKYEFITILWGQRMILLVNVSPISPSPRGLSFVFEQRPKGKKHHHQKRATTKSWKTDIILFSPVAGIYIPAGSPCLFHHKIHRWCVFLFVVCLSRPLITLAVLFHPPGSSNISPPIAQEKPESGYPHHLFLSLPPPILEITLSLCISIHSLYRLIHRFSYDNILYA